MKRLLSLCLIALCAGCPDPVEEKNPPFDHPYFPSSIIQKGNTLFVFASNFDQRYERANAMTVDLSVVNASLDINNPVSGVNAVTSSGFIPSFPDAPILTPSEDAVLYLARGDRTLRRIPLDSSGKLFACESSKTLGQDCYSGAPALSLDQLNPYYLGTFEGTGNTLEGGYISYMLDPGVLRSNEQGDFNYPQFYELDRFTWNSTSSTATRDQRFAIGNKLVPLTTPNIASRRFNARVGGLNEVGDYLYFLIDEPVEGLTVATLMPMLARVALADLQTQSSGSLTIKKADLTTIVNQISVHNLAVRELSDSYQFFITSGSTGRLIQLTMPKAQQLDSNNNLNVSLLSNPVTICNRPSDMKLTPDAAQSKLVIACDSGRILVLNADTLASEDVDPQSGPPFGRNPVKLHFDTNTTNFPFRLYTANFSDGSLSVFDLNNGSNPNQASLTRRGHIFQPSPFSRQGGTK